MKVAYVITRGDDIGGAQVHVLELATEMLRQGHEVCVFSGRGVELADRLSDRSIAHVQLDALQRDLSVVRDTMAFVELGRALRSFRPDLVSAHSSKAGVLVRIAARLLRLPCVFTAHGWSFGPEVELRSSAAHQRIERIVSRLATHTITVSERDRQIALEHLPLRADQVTTVRNGMPPSDARRIRTDNETIQLVSVARFNEQKDQETLIRGFHQADLDGRVQLVLVGDGHKRTPLEGLARDLGVADRIEFLGVRDDVAQILSDSDIFVLCTFWEGLPRSIIEAQRAGLPVIASRVGGIAEQVDDGVNGITVERGSVCDVAQAIRAVALDDNLRNSMSRASLQTYQAGFTLERTMAETIAVYASIVDVARARR